MQEPLNVLPMEGYNPQQFGAVPGLALEAADDMIVVTDLMRAARAMVIGALAVRGGEGTFAGWASAADAKRADGLQARLGQPVGHLTAGTSRR